MSKAGSSAVSNVINPGGKFQRRHLDRRAVVYVRQSTLQQVERHQESTRLQYGLVKRAKQYGWPAQRVEVIDDDLGRSGANAEGRPGFQRLVAMVGLDQVGIVLGIEMSRLARSCRDWHQLLEVCAVFGTLIGDFDGIYDPTVFNDRLLLGLKGTMSEAELHVIKQRMLQGKLSKARRGELGMRVPSGYTRRPGGEVIKDPDEQAQAVIEMIFAAFERSGTINGVLRYLVDHEIQVPHRVQSGQFKGELEWRRPNRVTLSNLLHHPIYAGAYVFGRRKVDPRKKVPGRPSTGRTTTRPEQWEVLLKERLPAYITWEVYERNQRQLEANTASAKGVVRKGPSLLSGLLICGRCGLRMAATYSNNGNGLRYSCSRMMVDYGEPHCQSLKGEPVDIFVSQMLFKALEPAALDVSLRVAEDVEAERERLHKHWQKRLERSRYEAERAQRQYNAVEPENRLVARQLEQAWEQALARDEELRDEYDRFLAERPTVLTEGDRAAIRKLASDIPALWNAQMTTSVDRQTIVRQLIDRVIVTVQGDTEKVDVEIHWTGGHKTGAHLVRPVARWDQLSYYKPLLSRVAALHGEGMALYEIAQRLNEEQWRPPKRRETFNREMVHTLLSRQGLTRRQQGDPMEPRRKKRRADEWTLQELARKLGMPDVTLYSWLRKGLLDARREERPPHQRWIVRADKAEISRLKSLRSAPRQWALRGRKDEPRG